MVKSESKKEWLNNDEAYRELGNAIVLQAVEDWKTGWKKLQAKPDDTFAMRIKESSEAFFNSDWYKTLCNFPAKELMDKLPGMAKQELYREVTQKWINSYIVTKVLKPGTKTNDKKIDNAYKRMKEAEEEMLAKYFINLYREHPEDLIGVLTAQADKQIEDEAERKRQEELAKKRAKELETRKSPRKKKKAV